jgi:hypothetical protein
MNSPRSGNPGATRVCPHCKATVLESAAICPGCRHHLRFSGTNGTLEAGEGYCTLNVDGTIAHTKSSEPCEYCVVLEVSNDRGVSISRQVVGVGVLRSGEVRRLSVSVEMMPVRTHAAIKTQATIKPLAPPGLAPPAAVPLAASGAHAAPPGPAGPNVAQPMSKVTAHATSPQIQRLGIIRRPR